MYLSPTPMRRRTPAISQDVGQCALAMRRAIERAPLGRYDSIMHTFPRSCCKVASQMLARYLATHARVPLVQFVSGRRHGEPYCKGGWQAHVWVEAGGVIIDITADQYDEMIHPVIASHDSDWHETFQVRSRIPYGEMMQMDGAYARRFERMYREVTQRMSTSTKSVSSTSGAATRAALGSSSPNSSLNGAGAPALVIPRAPANARGSLPQAALGTASAPTDGADGRAMSPSPVLGTRIPARVGGHGRRRGRHTAPGNGVSASLRRVFSFFGREPELIEPGS